MLHERQVVAERHRVLWLERVRQRVQHLRAVQVLAGIVVARAWPSHLGHARPAASEVDGMDRR